MAKDIYHDLVKSALINEGWSITHDPYFLAVGIGRRKVAADFAPERIPYLAMPKDAYEDLIREPIVQTFLERHKVKLIIFDVNKPFIYQWTQ